MRAESVFHDDDYINSLSYEAATSGVNNIPLAFLQLFKLDNLSTPLNNPYYTAIQVVVPILSMPSSQVDFATSLGFIRHMQPEFMLLLEQKDPRALLLMAYWYSKVRHGRWWMERRATLECQAICTYLERHHADETLLQELLKFPRLLCGLDSSMGGSSLGSGSSGGVLCSFRESSFVL